MSQTIYKSRVGLEIMLPMLLVLVGVSGLMAWQRQWAVFAFMVVVSAFVMYLLTGIRYALGNGVLDIRCGPFYRKQIDVATIRSLRPTRNPISSPAASLDRLEIRYGKYNWVIVSPKEKAAFIAHLQALKPEIEVMQNRRSKR